MIINPYAFGAALDADAQAFITAAGITDSTQKAALNTLVVDLKGYSIWTKCYAIYPMVGGTATTHKYNLKDPQDTNAAYRLVFGGGWTHSATGAQPNGTTGYADTFFNPTTVYANNALSFGTYLTTVSSLFADKYSMGGHSGASNFQSLNLSTATYMFFNGFSGGSIADRTVTNLSGFFQAQCDNANIKCAYGSSISAGVALAGNRCNVNLYLGALNLGGWYGGMDGTLGFAYMGDSLSNTELGNMNTAVQAFQVSLSRSV